MTTSPHIKLISHSYTSLYCVHHDEFREWVYPDLCRAMLTAPRIHRGRVHAMKARPEFATRELNNVVMSIPMPSLEQTAKDAIRPNLPWAEDHFQERVSGQPLNPAPSHKWWPFARADNAEHTDRYGRFSHTYPERMWPKRANPEEIAQLRGLEHTEINCGIRYAYGDLDDLVHQLKNEPFTRQAFLPIWFPEDTGAVFGGRVPCSIGYHFIRRNGALDCQYFMRSADILRYFVDDAYLSIRLTQWICDRLQWTCYPGRLTMFISNLHAFMSDEEALRRVASNSRADAD